MTRPTTSLTTVPKRADELAEGDVVIDFASERQTVRKILPGVYTAEIVLRLRSDHGTVKQISVSRDSIVQAEPRWCLYDASGREVGREAAADWQEARRNAEASGWVVLDIDHQSLGLLVRRDH